MRLVLSVVGVLTILAAVVVLRRRHVREHTPSLVEDLDRWNKSMPIGKPRQIYSGTKTVDRKALARALKGQKSRAKTGRDLRIVPDSKRRLG